MTRVLSYNILVGGARRVDAIEQVIRAADPDVVGLVEAISLETVKELARRLGMEYRMSRLPKRGEPWPVAVLTRLPIIGMQAHVRAELTKPLLEVTVEEQNGQPLTVFVTHLTSAFSHGRGGDSIRQKEVAAIIQIMHAKEVLGERHLLMGDFNALAPHDRFQASRLLSYLVELDRRRDQIPDHGFGHPHLDFVVPPALRFLDPLLRLIPRSRLLCSIFDELGTLYAPRGSVGLLVKAGYVDTFRYTHPKAYGFTCPAQAPAGRIDFIFASPELAKQLSGSQVMTEAHGLPGSAASDHLAVLAEFGEKVGLDASKSAPLMTVETRAYETSQA